MDDAKAKITEHLEDNSDWMGLAHIKRVIRCLNSEKDITHMIDIDNGMKIKTVISFIKEDNN